MYINFKVLAVSDGNKSSKASGSGDFLQPDRKTTHAMIPKEWIVTAAILSVCGAGNQLVADDTAEAIKALKKQIEELDQKVRILERNSELDKQAAENAKTAPALSIGAEGFALRLGDTNFVFKLRGLLQLDSRTYVNDGGIKNNDTFFLRRARPIFEGTVYHDFDFLFVPEFGGTGSPSILD